MQEPLNLLISKSGKLECWANYEYAVWIAILIGFLFQHQFTHGNQDLSHATDIFTGASWKSPHKIPEFEMPQYFPENDIYGNACN